jgi:hypothetical protein
MLRSHLRLQTPPSPLPIVAAHVRPAMTRSSASMMGSPYCSTIALVESASDSFWMITWKERAGGRTGRWGMLECVG